MIKNSYLYIFNYPPEREELCHLEFKYLFHQDMNSKYYITNQNIDENISVFIKGKIDIFYQSDNFKDLLEQVIESNLEYDDFKIIYYKNDNYHLDYQDSLNKCQSLSYGIGGSVDLKHPKTTLAFTKIDDTWIFGLYHHGVPSWNKHDDKPHTFSNSLDIMLARTLVNIAFENNHQLKGIDPCCGMGTVVLEGLACSYDIVGSDISRDISYKARLNLQHYNYDGKRITRKKIEEIEDKYDTCIIDLPYNLYTCITKEEQHSIINSSRNITSKLVLVTYEEMDQEIKDCNYVIIDKVKVGKNHYQNFARFVYVCM